MNWEQRWHFEMMSLMASLALPRPCSSDLPGAGLKLDNSVTNCRLTGLRAPVKQNFAQGKLMDCGSSWRSCKWDVLKSCRRRAAHSSSVPLTIAEGPLPPIRHPQRRRRCFARCRMALAGSRNHRWIIDGASSGMRGGLRHFPHHSPVIGLVEFSLVFSPAHQKL